MSEDSAIRINARLSGEDARRFRELEALEGSATQVIREAVREYHVKRIKPRRTALEIMTASGFVGGGEGPADLSSRYKEALTASLLEKHQPRPAGTRHRFGKTGRTQGRPAG